MNIFFVSALLPYPLFSGGQIRVYNLLKVLSRRHKITLFAFIRDLKERQFIDKLSFCQKVETVFRGHAWQPKYVLSAIFGRYPLLLSTYNNGGMSEKLAVEINQGKYDLIHIEPGYVWPALPKNDLPLIVAEHNIESTVYEGYVKRYPIVPLRPFLFVDVLKLKYWERRIWQKACEIVTVSEEDAAFVKRSAEKPVTVVSNGVDIQGFPFKPKSKLTGQLTLLFVGNFLWMQNRDALKHLLKDLWKPIKSKFPKARLVVVGRKMPEKLRNLSKQNNVEILENVDDINTEYQKCDILLAPIRIGGGTKFKILEAMASGIPVVTTSNGAVGLGLIAGQEVMVADTVQETLSVIEQMLDGNKRKKLILAARKKIEEMYTWEHIALKLENVWEKTHDEIH